MAGENNLFEFEKLCNEYEKLGSFERSALLVENSASVIKRLPATESHLDPVETLVAFIIGSVASDGASNEKDTRLSIRRL